MSPSGAITQPAARPGIGLRQELAALGEFFAILQQEQQALIAGDIDKLIPVVEEKTRLATSLNHFAVERQRLLSTAGLSNDRKGLEAWLAGQPLKAQDRADWKKLMALSADAQALNDSNGKLIAMRIQHNQQALNVLLTAANQTTVYGRDGQTKSSGGGHLFGKA